jgi:hypothetical protein
MVLAYVFLLIPILLAGLVFGAWFFLLLSTRAGRDAIRDLPYREFLGPGGPDDPFTVRIPRGEYEELRSRRRAQTGTVRGRRDADDEPLPHPDEQTELPPAA